MKEINKTMEKIRDHKYHGMGEKILDMDMSKPYIYLSDYSMDMTGLFGGDETSLGKGFPGKRKSAGKRADPGTGKEERSFSFQIVIG